MLAGRHTQGNRERGTGGSRPTEPDPDPHTLPMMGTPIATRLRHGERMENTQRIPGWRKGGGGGERGSGDSEEKGEEGRRQDGEDRRRRGEGNRRGLSVLAAEL